MTWSKDLKNYAPIVLRVGLGLVFVYFGWSGLMTPNIWTGLVPTWTAFLGSPTFLVQVHGTVELLGGLFLLVGLWVRWTGLALFLTLVHTLFLIDGATLVRDGGLAAALLSLVLGSEN